MSQTTTQRLPVLDMMRGVASFAVCWYHVTHGNVTFLPPGWFKSTGDLGWLGVQVFFVISGFVIPFALSNSGYRINNCGTFLLKRVARLDPPYIAGILVVIVLGYFSTLAPGFNGEPFHFSWTVTLLHLGYLNAFFGYPWLNPVYWTLAIEFQYYILIALTFPLLASRDARVRSILIMLFAGTALMVPAPQFVCHWLFLFLYGITTFQYRASLLSRNAYLLHLIAVAAGAVYCYGATIGLTGLLSALVIAFVNARSFGPLTWLGHISYSLYLLHVPVGGRVINLSSRFAVTLPAQILAVLTAAAASIAAAWLLHKFVEYPAQRWSAAIGYRFKRDVAPSGFAPREG